jgi:hypothetical protein
MEKNIEVTYERRKSDITSMTEAFFGFKPGTFSSNLNNQKLSVDDQEYKCGDERRREKQGNEDSTEESTTNSHIIEKK